MARIPRKPRKPVLTMRLDPEEVAFWDSIAGARGISRTALIELTMRERWGGMEEAPPQRAPRPVRFAREHAQLGTRE